MTSLVSSPSSSPALFQSKSTLWNTMKVSYREIFFRTVQGGISIRDGELYGSMGEDKKFAYKTHLSFLDGSSYVEQKDDTYVPISISEVKTSGVVVRTCQIFVKIIDSLLTTLFSYHLIPSKPELTHLPSSMFVCVEEKNTLEFWYKDHFYYLTVHQTDEDDDEKKFDTVHHEKNQESLKTSRVYPGGVRTFRNEENNAEVHIHTTSNQRFATSISDDAKVYVLNRGDGNDTPTTRDLFTKTMPSWKVIDRKNCQEYNKEENFVSFSWELDKKLSEEEMKGIDFQVLVDPGFLVWCNPVSHASWVLERENDQYTFVPSSLKLDRNAHTIKISCAISSPKGSMFEID